ncbi:alpha/beta hydrolase [Novosphingobium sp. AP12]|uniref:alpha/beta hydrolase n=1 Tax=Novosphingobium sp. AP12 TaxID=1144305 RepID=UPI000271F103|nr:alpha/beta hydrolase [Novosphingobium sp. AP12]EJL34351.1 esterase/lipase [Novosphingobium sp. AP12]
MTAAPDEPALRNPGASRRSILGGLASACALAATRSGTAHAGPRSIVYSGPFIPLWPGAAPGATAEAPIRAIEQRSSDANFDDRWVTGIATPTLEVRRPAYQDGSAVVIVPGGGYGFLSVDNEGEEQARWLSERGVTCFILYYRLPQEGWKNQAVVPLQDIQRAIRVIRARAGEFGVDPARVAVLGFSAGGHLAGSIATRFDERVYTPVDTADNQSARPALVGMIYPVVTLARPFAHAGSRDALLGPASSSAARKAGSIENRVARDTPPVFLAAASDDGLVPIANSVAMYGAMLANERPVEFHGFDKGGHGFGSRLPKEIPAHAWPDLFYAYGRRQGVYTA